MSALDFTARALAMRAAAHAPLRFGELAQAGLPTSVTRIESSGFAAPGWGAGTYVSDELCDAALHSAHPAAVFPGADGRHFRLAGNLQGYVTPEQLGCPRYSQGIDQRRYIQAAIDYVEAVGLKGVVLTQERYELWRTPLSPDFAGADYGMGHGLGTTGGVDRADEGHFLIIRKPMRLIGTHPLKATLHCKGPNGGSLLTDYTVIDGTAYGDGLIHRGDGIVLWGTASIGAAKVADADVPSLYAENIVLLSDAVGVKDNRWPAKVSVNGGNSWDPTNRGYFLRPDYQCGRIDLHNCEVRGFLGEAHYSGMGCRGSRLTQWYVRDSNAQGFNPSVMKRWNGRFEVDGFHIENCAFGCEGWTELARISNGRFINCGICYLAGGDWTGTGLLENDRLPAAEFGNVEFNDCTVVQIGGNMRGDLRLIDTPLRLEKTPAVNRIANVDLDVSLTVHKSNLGSAISFFMPDDAAPQSVRNVNIRLRLARSDYAKANGKYITGSVVAVRGSIGEDCVVRVSGTEFSVGATKLLSVTGAFTDYRVKVIDDGIDLSTAMEQPITFDATTNPVIEPGYLYLRPVWTALGTGLGLQNTCSLPAAGNFNDGHEVRIAHNDYQNPNCTLLVDGRVLLGFRDEVVFRCDRKQVGHWDIVEAPKPRKGTASLGIASTPRGAESGPYAIPVMGCRPNMIARVLPPATGIAGFVLSAVRAGIDQVQFWVRNVDGADAADLGVAAWTALVSGPER